MQNKINIWKKKKKKTKHYHKRQWIPQHYYHYRHWIHHHLHSMCVIVFFFPFVAWFAYAIVYFSKRRASHESLWERASISGDYFIYPNRSKRCTFYFSMNINCKNTHVDYKDIATAETATTTTTTANYFYHKSKEIIKSKSQGHLLLYLVLLNNNTQNKFVLVIKKKNFFLFN